MFVFCPALLSSPRLFATPFILLARQLARVRPTVCADVRVSAALWLPLYAVVAAARSVFHGTERVHKCQRPCCAYVDVIGLTHVPPQSTQQLSAHEFAPIRSSRFDTAGRCLVVETAPTRRRGATAPRATRYLASHSVERDDEASFALRCSSVTHRQRIDACRRWWGCRAIGDSVAALVLGEFPLG